MVLLYGPRGRRFLMSKVTLYQLALGAGLQDEFEDLVRAPAHLLAGLFSTSI
jgi:hypothetical protein